MYIPNKNFYFLIRLFGQQLVNMVVALFSNADNGTLGLTETQRYSSFLDWCRKENSVTVRAIRQLPCINAFRSFLPFDCFRSLQSI